MSDSNVDLCVIGLGYVGMPLAQEACRNGLRVMGVDLSQPLVDSLNGGTSHVDDLSDSDVADMFASGFSATTDASVIAQCDAVVICVPTPLSVDGGPDLGAVAAASQTIALYVRPETLVVLESTTWPGTTEEVVLPILETSGLTVGQDIYLAFSPERIDPGNPQYGLRNTPKVVGGATARCSERAESFYARVVDTLVVAKGPREAEMAKLLENTYRHINIALVNEMAKFSHELGIDFWNVIECARTKPFGFQAFYPGPGVGGHCIPIDPNYLSHRVRAQLGYPFRFVELAQEINLSMPQYVARRAQGLLNDSEKAVRGSHILLLGVTYKGGIADQRMSPAVPLGSELASLGARLQFYDPFIREWNVGHTVLTCEPDLESAMADADLVIHLQPHATYDQDVISRVKTPILDTRGVFVGENVTLL